MSRQLIAEARELCKKATLGPWTRTGTRMQIVDSELSIDGTDIKSIVCDVWSNNDDDAAFIARSRTIIPELCDALEQAEEQNKQLMHEVCRLACESVERDRALAKLESEVEGWAKAKQEGRLVVLPCKVGDIIYGYPFCWAEETISEHGILEWKVACIHCSVNKAGKTRATVRATVWRQYNGNEYAYITEDIPFEDFGKTVFLTRAEAEAAMEGE